METSEENRKEREKQHIQRPDKKRDNRRNLAMDTQY